ncbi:hypothetical protein KI387_013500 [Taxus chinensis]|uniref:Protein transport protein Sec24-like CEF n=1 Tax=Taxus chinensis TaxID=29808 RepID=A0AA38FH85_TAXCH|nr:hypothetical protein KI387_013500 [Taxus chinensis]
MVSPVPSGERPGYPNSTGYAAQRPFTPMPSDSAGGLAGSMQNLNINRPPPPPWAAQQATRPDAAPQGMQNSAPPPFTPAGSRPMGMGMPFPSPIPPHGAPRPSIPPPLGVMASGPPGVTTTGRPGPVVRPTGPPYGGGPPPVSAPNSNMVRPAMTPFVQRPNAPPSRPARDGLGSPFAPGMNLNSSNEVINGSSTFVQGAPSMRPPLSQGPNAMHPPVGPPRSSGPIASLGAGTVLDAQRTSASAIPPPQFPAASHTPSPAPPTIYPAPGLAPSSAPLPPFSVARQGGPQLSSSLYGTQPWQPPSQQRSYPDNYVPPPPPAAGNQAPGMFGMPGPPRQLSQTIPPMPSSMGHPPGTGVLGMGQPGSPAGTQASGPSRIDPNQIPRPVPSSTLSVFETRSNNQANLPPSATSDFIARDTGNCSPRYMRCTLNQIPCTGDLSSTSGMPLALVVQPFALPHPSEEAIQVVDFGENGPVRCSRCKGYINPFMRFIDQGRRFICNLCGFSNETPREYHCNLGPDGRRRDAAERPELCRGTVEFVATKEYMVRDPMPAVFFFLIDVSMNAIQTGATAAACSAINRAIADLPVSL